MRSLALMLAVTTWACSGGDPDESGPGGAGGDGVGGSTSSATAAGGNAACCDVPISGLEAYLESGAYRSFASESDSHNSSGPHFGNVRSFVSPKLAASLAAGDEQHPAGAAAVKELYGEGTEELLGWSVWIKLESESADGANIYWYEAYQGVTYADAAGAGLCTGCHSAGRDFYRGDYPLP